MFAWVLLVFIAAAAATLDGDQTAAASVVEAVAAAAVIGAHSVSKELPVSYTTNTSTLPRRCRRPQQGRITRGLLTTVRRGAWDRCASCL